MSNKLYDILKLVSMIATPLATFILTLTDIWGFNQYGTAIAASVSALGILLGAILKISTDKYWQNVDEGSDDDAEG
jgi:hypothetical protein